jgi:REP element-mobilizing transposase RayT
VAEYESQRRSIRLKGYDYTSAGAYFVTICTHAHEPLFENPTLKEILKRTWYGQQERFRNVSLDAFVVMPNHIHFVVWLNPVGAPLAGAHAADHTTRAGASPAPTLGQLVGAFKSIVATKWLMWLKQNAPHRPGRVWQRNYYERVIRDEPELNRVREYIRLNPLKWEFDCENPQRVANHDYQREWGWLEAEQVAAWAPSALPEG